MSLRTVVYQLLFDVNGLQNNKPFKTDPSLNIENCRNFEIIKINFLIYEIINRLNY